jgi:hypothetical protein
MAGLRGGPPASCRPGTSPVPAPSNYSPPRLNNDRAMTDNFPSIRACIFDVDGTLVNTEDIYTEIYNKILREYGRPDYPWDIKALQQSRGTPVIMLEKYQDSSLHISEHI